MKNGRKNINPIWILIAILLLVIGMPVGAVVYFYVSLNSSMIAEILYNFRYVYIVAIAFPLFIVVFVFILLPVLRFIFKRIACYFSLWFSCKMNKFKFKITRFPFASLYGIRVKEDIRIKNKDKTFCIHFIDIVGRGRVFSIVNANEYDIARTTPDAPKRLGAPYYGGVTGARIAVVLSSTINSGETRKFPEFDPSIGEHIIMLDPLPMEVRYVDGAASKSLFSGYSIGNITYYEAKDFIKLLKRV